MRNRIILSIVFVLVLGGCNPYREIKFDSFTLSSFELKSTSVATIIFKVEIENPLETSVALSTLEGTLLKEYIPFATIRLVEDVIVPANTTQMVLVRVEIVLLDPMSLLSMGLNIKSWDISEFRINAKIGFQSGSGGARTFKFKNVPLERMVIRLNR